jgi:hypothetical protein
MKTLKELREKTLTPAEKKKREEIAKAMERENPGMDMKKKMAIATWQAKKVAEAKEDDMPASPDEASMAMKQLEFIEYAAEEMMDHIKSGKPFPEWFQNKLSKAHGEIEGLHSAMGEHGEEDDDMNEATKVDEVLDTPKAMDSYKNKAKYGLDRAKNSAVASTLRKDKPSFDKAVKTMSKREKGLKMADKNATRKTLNKLRKEDVMSADKKPEKYVKPDGKVGIRMVRVDKKVVDKDA